MNDSYKSEYTFTPNCSFRQRPHHLIDTSLNCKLNRRYFVRLYGKYLTNQYTYVGGHTASTIVYVPWERRTYGIMADIHLWPATAPLRREIHGARPRIRWDSRGGWRSVGPHSPRNRRAGSAYRNCSRRSRIRPSGRGRSLRSSIPPSMKTRSP